jgi:hypothetical protein
MVQLTMSCPEFTSLQFAKSSPAHQDHCFLMLHLSASDDGKSSHSPASYALHMIKIASTGVIYTIGLSPTQVDNRNRAPHLAQHLPASSAAGDAAERAAGVSQVSPHAANHRLQLLQAAAEGGSGLRLCCTCGAAAVCKPCCEG